jgi:hypothetical protein
MSTIEKVSEEALNILKNLIDPNMATVEYNGRRKEFNIRLKESGNYALCIAEEDDDNENGHIRFGIEIHAEDGFYNFFKVFPSLAPIDYKENQIVVDKFRFLHSFMVGKDFEKSVSTIDDYKFFFRYDGSNYRFISQIGMDDPRFDPEQRSFIVFTYDYYFNYTMGTIDVEKSVEFELFEILNESCHCNNVQSDIQDILDGILNDAAKKIERPVEELTLKDSTLLSMIHI